MSQPDAEGWILERLAAIDRRLTELEEKLGTQPPTTARGKASAITDSWRPRDRDVEWAREAHPNVNEAAERGRFVDYWLARGEPRKDWNAAYRNWIRKAAEFSAAPVTALPGRPQTRTAAIAEANRARRDRIADKLVALWGDAPRDEVHREGDRRPEKSGR